MPLLPVFRQRLRDYLASLIPTARVTVVNPLSQPFALAPLMTVDRIQEILRSAEAGDPRDLFSVYRDTILADSHLQGELSKRMLAVLGDTFSCQPRDKTNADDVAAAAAVQAAFENCPTWQAGIAHLLGATLWPVSVVEKVYQPTPTGYALAELVPVDPQLLDFTSGWLRIRRTDPVSHFPTSELMDSDPNRYIVHRGHLLSTPDHWGGPMRSLLFWWLLGAMNREWWGRFLDRFGTPFLLGKYDQSDDASRSILANAFRLSAKIGGLVVSRETEVSIMQAATTDSGEAFEKFYTLTRREMSKLILGQTLSAEAQPTGLGSGTSDLQSEVRDDIRQFDALRLGATLTLQLAKQFLLINNLPGRPPKLVWGGNSTAAATALGALLKTLKDAGLQVADDALPLISERVGFNVGRAPVPPPPQPPGAGGPELPALSAYAVPRLPLPLRTVRHHANAADAANDAIAREGAADLARAFRGSLAPVRQIIESSRSASECELRLVSWFAANEPGRAADLIEQALVAHAANGAARLAA